MIILTPGMPGNIGEQCHSIRRALNLFSSQRFSGKMVVITRHTHPRTSNGLIQRWLGKWTELEVDVDQHFLKNQAVVCQIDDSILPTYSVCCCIPLVSTGMEKKESYPSVVMYRIKTTCWNLDQVLMNNPTRYSNPWITEVKASNLPARYYEDASRAQCTVRTWKQVHRLHQSPTACIHMK